MPPKENGISTILPVIGATIGAVAQGFQNRANRKFQTRVNQQNMQYGTDMYNKQRQDALTDLTNANAYNSPEQQMNRLRQAGLNPNLVYGKGADNTSAMVRSAQAQQGNAQAPSIQTTGTAQGIQTYTALKQSQAMTDQVYQNIALAKAEENLKQLTSSNMAIRNAYDQNSLEQARKLNDSVLLKANLENKTLESNISLNTLRNNREEIAQTKNLELTTENILTQQQNRAQQLLQNSTLPLQKQKLTEEIAQIQEQRNNLKKEGLLKDFELKMQSSGITKDSPWYTKFLTHYLAGGTPLTLEEIDKMRNKAPIPLTYKLPSRD